MSKVISIDSILDSSDIVFLDNSFFCNDVNSGFFRELYNVWSLQDLDKLSQDMISFNSFLSQVYCNVILSPNVFVTPEVLENLRNFAGILQHNKEFYSDKSKFPTRRSEGRNQLKGLGKNVGKIDKDIKIYAGKVYKIDEKVKRKSIGGEEIPDFNYEIVGSALGYLLSNDKPKIASILTKNRRFPLIVSDIMSGPHKHELKHLLNGLLVYMGQSSFENYFRRYGVVDCDKFAGSYLEYHLGNSENLAVSN